MGDVREALDMAVEAATHLGPMDAGAIEAARALADKIDAWDVIVQWAVADAHDDGPTARPKVPANDNTSLPTFLRFCESLGLTPAGRKSLEAPKEAPGGKLALLQGAAQQRRRSA